MHIIKAVLLVFLLALYMMMVYKDNGNLTYYFVMVVYLILDVTGLSFGILLVNDCKMHVKKYLHTHSKYFQYIQTGHKLYLYT